MSKKYKLTQTSIKVNTTTLYQIQALRSFNSVEEGSLGGWVKSENNLSHEGNAWIRGNARISGDARIYGNAWVSGDAWIYGDARVYGNALVGSNALVSGGLNATFDFSSLDPSVSEITINNIKYIKKTTVTWVKQN